MNVVWNINYKSVATCRGAIMKVIRLTYRDDKIEPSVDLLLFFRMAGIYVYERFWGVQSIKMDGLEMSNEEKVQRPSAFVAYDCNIFLFQTENDIREYELLPDKQANDILIKEKTIVGYDGLAIEYKKEKYKEISDNALLCDIVDDMLKKQIISVNERNDLAALAEVYKTNKLPQLTLKAKYFFVVNDNSTIKKVIQDYEKLIEDLIKIMQDNKCQWGAKEWFHTQFAVVNMIYELNCFCVRYRENLAYDRDSLLAICNTLEKAFHGILDDSIIMLKGQIYDDLFSNPNKAYEYYVECCHDKMTYNAYVYFRKGNYWQNFGNDWRKALKYYIQSVCVYPQYYRAWYKIGLCYQKLGEYRESVAAYENVQNCLWDRIMGQCVRPMEIDHLFKAYIQIAKIWEDIENIGKAIDALKWAEKMYDLIDRSEFFEFMCQSNDVAQYYREKTRENVDITYVYSKMITLNSYIGDNKEVLNYQEKSKR